MSRQYLREEIERKLTSTIEDYLTNWEPKTTNFLDKLFPEERRVHSIMTGLLTSMGTKVWEHLARFCAEHNGYKIMNVKELKRPNSLPPQITDVIVKWEHERLSGKGDLLLEGYIRELRETVKRYELQRNGSIPYQRGEGVDLCFYKEGKFLLVDMKTVQPNQGGGNKFNKTIMNWYAYFIIQNPDVEVNCFIGFPYNPYVPESWWSRNGGRVFPLVEGIDAKIENDVWDLFSGYDDTWSIIQEALDNLSMQNLSGKFKHIFYPETK